ncbi:MAG: MqnA/MqnD/SBP family protein, partial [Chitinophagaceae bacterium]
MQKISLGFSPCPNDTFIFDALVNGLIDTEGLTFDYVMEDVETLNEWALAGKLMVTKLSYGVLGNVLTHYKVLNSGGALGMGVGPLLVSNKKEAVITSDSTVML